MQLGAYRAFRESITGHCLSLGMMSSLISVAARCAPWEASWVWCFSENSPEWPAASGLVPALALGRRGTAWGGDSWGLAGGDPYHVRVRVRTGKGKNGYRLLPNTRTRTAPYPHVPLCFCDQRVVRVRVRKGKGKNGYWQKKIPGNVGPQPAVLGSPFFGFLDVATPWFAWAG